MIIPPRVRTLAFALALTQPGASPPSSHDMPLSAPQKAAIEHVINAITSVTSRRTKRRIADMFLDLVDRESWPEYYQVIPQPRCINGVKASLAQNKYKSALDAWDDLHLVFLNALHYNEDGSQIAKDATLLKGILDSEWRQQSILPAPPLPSGTEDKKEEGEDRASSSRLAGKLPAKASSGSPEQAPPTPGVPAPPTAGEARKPVEVVMAVPVRESAATPEVEPTQDMDVDVGGTPEPEVGAQDSARDGESEQIVRQLEKGLPRWPGFDDVGWSADLSPERMVDMVAAVNAYRDESGSRLAASLEAVPEETEMADLSFSVPLSLRLVESRVRSEYYETSQAFDREMAQLFLKGRRWYEPGTEPYGHVLVLQRLYQALTSATPPTPPYTSTTGFAALPAGPGTATPLHSGEGDAATRVTTFRVSEKDKRAVEEVVYKGWRVRVADWVHVSNADDGRRPVVGQVFKCFVSEERQRRGQMGVSVCWYYRPEQTWHAADRQFWDHEVFKTGHFADHPLEDIIEKIAVQFTARHVRGRPRPPFWHPGWPLYVCDARYHDRERAFVKIKNWNSCIPDEVRKNESFMQIYPFERPVVPPRRPSPFLTGAAVGPGGLLAAEVVADKDKDKDKAESESGGGVGTRSRTRPKRTAAKPEPAGTGAVPMQPSTSGSQQPAGYAPREDRSIVAAAGGLAALGSNASLEELPQETARHFDRDPESNEVLWFAAPPVDIVHTPPPRHSLKYLAFLARKRKVHGERDGTQPAKRHRMPMTVSETLGTLLRDSGLDDVAG